MNRAIECAWLGVNAAVGILDVSAFEAVSKPETPMETKIVAVMAAGVFTFLIAFGDAFILTRKAITRR